MSPRHSALHKRIASQLLRPYQCTFCYKTFQKQNHLTRHVKIHSDERRHKCPYCGKAFLRSDNLKKHIRIHTGEKFPCPFCSRGFTDSSNLTKHIRTHTGEGRHRCNFCLKHYAGLTALQRHMQEHEEEMVFATDASLTKIERTDDDTSNLLSYMEQNGHLTEKEPQRQPYPLLLEKTQNSFPEDEEPYSDNGNSIVSNLSLVKTERDDILDYLSHAEQNGHSNENELYQLSQRPASPSLPKRNQDSLDEPYFVNSNLLPQFQEPVVPAVPRKLEKAVNPFKSNLQNVLDSSCLDIPQKSSPFLDTDKTLTLFASKDQRLVTKVTTSDLLQELARPVSTSQDLDLWQCVLCLDEFSSCVSLLSHLKGHVTDGIQITDPWEQDDTVVTKGSSPAEKLNCRYCHKVFTQQSELLAHMDLTLCKNCGTIFACSLLLEQHQDICKINWMDKARHVDKDNCNNVVIGQCPVENYQETDAESQTLDTKDFPLLTAVKQEIIFPETEDAIPDPHLSTSKSLLAAAELDRSLNKALSTSDLIDSTRMLTDGNVLSPRQEPNPNSNQQISTETIPNYLKESQVFDSGLAASLNLLPKPEPIDDEIVSVNPEDPFTLLDSELHNIGRDIPDSTKDFSFTESVYKAYECAKAALDNTNGFQHQDIYSSSCDIRSFWCQNCGKNYQSVFEFREHLKFLQKFIGKSCPQNSKKLEALLISLDNSLPFRASDPLERNLAEDDAHLELSNTEIVQNQPFQPPSQPFQPPSQLVQPPNQPVQPSSVALNTNYNPSSLTCNVCHKKFSRTTQLNRHRKIHFGVKDHKCSFCSKTFLRSDNLKKHLRIHLGIKQYACPICKRRFTDSSNLVKHQRIHNSERQGYFCNLCFKRFVSYKGFCKHNQIHNTSESTTDDNEVGSVSQTFIEGQSTTDECFADNDVGFSSVEIAEKTVTVSFGMHTKNNSQLKIIDADVRDKSSGSSKTNQFEKHKKELSKKVNSSNSKNSNLSRNNSNSRDFSSHLKHPAEQEIDSSDSPEQNQISSKNSKLSLNPNYESLRSSPEEFSVYLRPHDVTMQSLGEDRLKTKKLESLVSSNDAKQTGNPKLAEKEANLQVISSSPQESSATLKSLLPELSENSQAKPCETLSVNTTFASLTKQIKDNLTLDSEDDKTTYRSPQLESRISEEQKLSEMNPINIEMDQNLKTSTINQSPLFASCDSARKKPILKKVNSDLPDSGACFTDNPTEDKLEMSAYYSMQTSKKNFIKPVPQESQLVTCLW